MKKLKSIIKNNEYLIQLCQSLDEGKKLVFLNFLEDKPEFEYLHNECRTLLASLDKSGSNIKKP